MDFTVISTYRCNSKCSTCNVWQHPSRPAEEISLETLRKIPSGIDNLNITGGEPTLREDLFEMVEILYPKAKKLEISSNGLHPERLEAIIQKYPDVKIRFSLEGFGDVNDTIRGEENGFQTKVDGLKRLKALGGCDLGFATVIQDDNIQDLVKLYAFTQEMGVEMATSALHNGFQFHKGDNFPYNRKKVAKEIEKLIVEMLRTNSVKNWFRAYLNLGLMEKILGHDRLISCSAGTDFVFVDPWGDLYACNVRPDLYIGNLETQSWEEVFQGELAQQVRQKVSVCTQNCWMVGSARTAMRNPKFTSLPKFRPMMWVALNKAKVTLNLPISFERYVDYKNVVQDKEVANRPSYLNSKGIKRMLQRKNETHYQNFGAFHNR